MTASGHESGEGDRVTASERSQRPPDEQGIASAVAVTSSGSKTSTGHAKSDPGETGSGPRTATGLAESESEHDATGSGPKIATARGRTATETRPADDVLDRLTASGKQSESEIDR